MFRTLAFKTALLGTIVLIWAGMASMNNATATSFPAGHGLWSYNIEAPFDRIGGSTRH